MALDDTTMQPLWKINVGVGFNAPPMTFEAGGKQYVAIISGLSRIALGKHALRRSSRNSATHRCCSCSGCDTKSGRSVLSRWHPRESGDP